MPEKIERSFRFPPFFSRDAGWVQQQLSGIHVDLFGIFGFSTEISTKCRTREYEEGAGWLQFPCKEETLAYFTDSAKCTLVKTSMFNGHIGDTEENVVMSFESTAGKIDLYINLYASPVLLRYHAEGISSEISARVEQLLQRTFELSEFVDEGVRRPEIDDSETTNSAPDSHYNHK